MSGGVPGAESGALSLMVGGDPATIESLAPVFAPIATTVVHLGGIGSGQLAKACNQVVVAGTITALCEALSLADRYGLPRADLLTALSGGLRRRSGGTERRSAIAGCTSTSAAAAMRATS